MLDLNTIRKKYFPFQTADGYIIRPSTQEEVYALYRKVFTQVFKERQIFFQAPVERRPQTERMYQKSLVKHHEWFVFESPTKEKVGWNMGDAYDYTTFYMRNTGVLPEHQNKGLYRQFCERFEAFIKDVGYERIVSHHYGTNRRILITKLKMGYVISGMELHEMFGPLVKVLKLLPEDRREAYYKIYGSMDHWE